MGADLDVLVIGGGANGTGLARDLAKRGLSVLLCEKGDLKRTCFVYKREGVK